MPVSGADERLCNIGNIEDALTIAKAIEHENLGNIILSGRIALAKDPEINLAVFFTGFFAPLRMTGWLGSFTLFRMQQTIHDTSKEFQHRLAGLGGKREGIYRQLLAGLQRQHVGRLLVHIRQRQLIRALG